MQPKYVEKQRGFLRGKSFIKYHNQETVSLHSRDKIVVFVLLDFPSMCWQFTLIKEDNLSGNELLKNLHSQIWPLLSDHDLVIPAKYESLTVQLNSALDQLRVATRQRELAEREVLSLKERLRAKENSLEEMIADLKDMKPDRKTQEKLAAAQEQDKKVAQLTEEVGSLTHTVRTFDRQLKLIWNSESF